MTTIKTYRQHRDGLVAVVKTSTHTVSVWTDGTVTRIPVVDGREDGPEENVTEAAIAAEVEI